MLKNSWIFLPARGDVYRAKQVFFLFLVSLAVLFAAGMLAYCIIRANAFRRGDVIDYIPLRVPISFWISTPILLFVSLSLHRAVSSIHRNRLPQFHHALAVAAMAALAFTFVQGIGLNQLLQVHLGTTQAGASRSYAMCFFMAFVHAAHVLGGVSFLGFVIAQALRQRYDHERHWPVDNCANYWHFLDVVWLVMLGTFFIAR